MINVTHFNDTADSLLAFGALVALFAGWWRWIRPRWKSFSRKITSALDSLVGREAIVDSITGEEKVPALPGIGVRMAHQEQQMELLTETVAKMVDQGAAISELRHDMVQAQRDILHLQTQVVERVASKVEQTEMWKAVQRIQDEDPAVDGDSPEDGAGQ